MRSQVLIFQLILIIVFQGLLAQNSKAVQTPAITEKTIKIGLLIPDKNSLAALHGAEMAIRKANEKGGFNGKPFKLLVRSMEGPWGTGSKQAVDLIFTENVCAIIGSSDGRNGHLIEQVTTKARIVFLSVWSSDPTLAQAFVPWYFSCVATDNQQADALIEEIYNKRKIDRIALVSDSSYDSRLAVESFAKRTKLTNKTDPVQIFYDNQNQNFNPIINQISKAHTKGIVLFGRPSVSIRLIQLLKESKIKQSLFGALSLLDENDFPGAYLKSLENMVLVSSDNADGLKCITFRDEFQKTYGKKPGAVAEYAFDGTSLLIQAIRSAGTDRDDIRKALAKTKYNGVTGLIQFDEKGKRSGAVNLVKIKNGIPVDIDKK